jgi:pimeloyl-ACP methyl ester carboxylesterase
MGHFCPWSRWALLYGLNKYVISKTIHVLLLDLRGHGDSKTTLKTAFKQKYTFSALANDILEVLDFLEIKKSHFVGISLGTILIRQLKCTLNVYKA